MCRYSFGNYGLLLTMAVFRLRLVTTSSDHPSQMYQNVVAAIGRHHDRVDVTVRRVSKDGLQIEIRGERAALDAAHMQISKSFATQNPFVRVLDELGDTLRQEAYPLLGRLEQELRAFINEAMISAGLGIDWLSMLDDTRLSARILATAQKGHSVVYQHPVEFTELDHLLDIVTLDLAAWAEERSITAGDLLSLLENGSDLTDIQAALQRRMRKRSFWDVVFSPFFDDLQTWSDWKLRWQTEVIGLRNKVMHHRPVFDWEIVKLRKTATEFTALLDQHRHKLSMKDEEVVRQAAKELMATFRIRRDLHMALGGTMQSGISIASKSNAIFLFCAGEPSRSKVAGNTGHEEVLILYEGEGRHDQTMTRGNRAIRDHVADGREIYIFASLGKGRGIHHIGQAEYRSHRQYYDSENQLKIRFELSLIPSTASEQS